MSVSFGDSIRRGRAVVGLSQAKVAELIGKSPSTVRSWELGRTSPSEPGVVSALAAVLGIDESTLLGRAGFAEPVLTPRLSLQQELESLRHNDPTPIPPPEPLPPKVKAPRDDDSRQPAVSKPSRFALRSGPPRHLVPEGIEIQPLPPLLAAATLPPVTEEKSGTEEKPISVTVLEAAKPAAPRRQRKVTVLPQATSGAGRSYIEDSDQRELYRWRGVVTVVCLVVLLLAFWWALRNLGSAVSDFFGSFIDLLNF